MIAKSKRSLGGRRSTSSNKNDKTLRLSKTELVIESSEDSNNAFEIR